MLTENFIWLSQLYNFLHWELRKLSLKSKLFFKVRKVPRLFCIAQCAPPTFFILINSHLIPFLYKYLSFFNDYKTLKRKNLHFVWVVQYRRCYPEESLNITEWPLVNGLSLTNEPYGNKLMTWEPRPHIYTPFIIIHDLCTYKKMYMLVLAESKLFRFFYEYNIMHV